MEACSTYRRSPFPGYKRDYFALECLFYQKSTLKIQEVLARKVSILEVRRNTFSSEWFALHDFLIITVIIKGVVLKKGVINADPLCHFQES